MRLALIHRQIDPSRGGAETYVVDLAARLLAAGHSVDVVTSGVTEGALPPGVRIVNVPAPALTRMGAIWKFAVESERHLRARPDAYDCTIGFINTWHQDILIPQGGVHSGSLAANARRYGPVARAFYLLSKRINPKSWGLYRAIERRQFDPARSTRYVAVSRMVQRDLQQYWHVDPERITIIPNAIDPDRMALSDADQVRREFRRQHGLSDTDTAGLFIAHNFRLKGLGPLLESIARYRRQPGAKPGLKLLVCGGGEIPPFRQMAEKLGIADAVKFLGRVPDVRVAYHGADFHVLPTYYDPCSLVVFEAMACGLPVITTRCNGAGELIEPGVHGFVVDRPDSLEALADALGRMTDPVARRAMAEQATRLGQEQSMDRHVASLLALAGRVAAGRRTVPAPAGLNRAGRSGTPQHSGHSGRSGKEAPR